jgi:hypothetical protein
MGSWKPEMLCQGQWVGNGQRFATRGEAEKSGRALLMRWFVPTDCRAVETEDEVNYTHIDGRDVRILLPEEKELRDAG